MSRLRSFAGLVLGLVAAMPLHAAFEDDESGVRAEGMAGAFIAVADDISALDYNPAGLFQVESRQFSGFYKLLYGGTGVGLHSLKAGVGVPLGKWGTTALRIQETGFELTSQRSVRVGHGIRLAEGLAAGCGLSVYNLVQQEFGQGYALGIDLGMFCRVYRYWTAGFYGRNLNMPRIGDSDLPRLVGFGLGFSPNPGIRSAFDVTKEPGRLTRLAVGQELRIVPDYLTLRAGVQTEPVRLGFGLRTGTSRVRVDYALLTHTDLLLTHNVGLTLEF